MSDIGDVLKQARLAKGLRQQDVEARSGGILSQNYISQVERGGIEAPGFDKLAAFAEVLRLDLNALKIAAGYPVVTPVGLEGEGGGYAAALRDPNVLRFLDAFGLLEEEDWDDINRRVARRRRERELGGS